MVVVVVAPTFDLLLRDEAISAIERRSCVHAPPVAATIPASQGKQEMNGKIGSHLFTVRGSELRFIRGGKNYDSKDTKARARSQQSS